MWKLSISFFFPGFKKKFKSSNILNINQNKLFRTRKVFNICPYTWQPLLFSSLLLGGHGRRSPELAGAADTRSDPQYLESH